MFRNAISILLLCCLSKFGFSQQANDKGLIERAGLDYVEGFYEGDTLKLIRSLKSSLYKIGFWKNEKTGKYDPDGQMTYRQALDYAKKVFEKKGFAKEGSPKKVEILDILNTTAVAKVTVRWGIDYILLSKQDDKWMIEEVLWEGPLKK